MTPTTSIPVRNVEFAIDESVPRDWHDAGAAPTVFLDSLSILFPEGERFFIRSVRKHLSHVKDPQLRRAVRAFCGQEAMHGREHERMNEVLKSHGYDVDTLEREVTNLIGFFETRIPDRWSLAATCALEHYTALLADHLLSRPEILQGAHPEMAALFRWHAIEETEHKAVAFDVYEAAGGNTPERAAIMVLVTVVFWARLLEQQVRMMRARGIASSVSEWRKLGRFMFGGPGRLQELAWPLAQYCLPGFHPWQHDNHEYVQAWVDEEGPARLARSGHAAA